jgi:membrane associated rhomboid family serine protease
VVAWEQYTIGPLASAWRSRESPATHLLLSIITGVFLFQIGVWVLTPGVTIEGFTVRLFLEAPVWSWVLSFFLHRDAVHYLTNVGIILLAGRLVEPYFPPLRYWLFVAAAVGGSVLGGFLVLAAFSSNVVVLYGASGFAYALMGYGLTLGRRGDRDAPENLLLLVGVIALALLCYDVLAGPYFRPDWFNGGHAGGYLVGVIAGALHRA